MLKPPAFLQQVNHRPWPLPQSPWIMHQRWCDLLFAHWPVPVESLLPLLPAGLELDTYEGQAWIAVVPFRMENVKPRFAPAVPWLSAFPELNVRTYVRKGDKAGVWFVSLDAANPVAVEIARSVYRLPYFNARMSLQNEGRDWIRYQSQRTDLRAQTAALKAIYRPVGREYLSRKGTLEHWLTERYCLYTSDAAGQIYCGEIHHAPWSLQKAEAQFDLNTMTLPIGLKLSHEATLLHFVRKIDVVAWQIVKV
ncbi:hypothetical protein COW36_21280 [bacterium (Candidatus Blackallbacteria) CG17_big_fil_post_rev_8_21_14_2_50_48_46]|uniref:DUF2071 domain-containing protein n=1 Tax=bacterium (Candidatus Blackallbacteria) CG17_big_fil_post_rev_8_21_14_2_50_48_46 TaxID=2014261 RepID=A0A2M7FYX6_9BACT|nr:MAG: hypothetical protein COW64_14590 [bacterium (Candidatus Blackallbacteria) CG18_big_fil_WC_8_21_14_2_50_49_26]PIW14573.1 MAG: hypothetical protein COW36_21280 [bacterium (Candidatus Blackallbacteria) CG17_big_fil_post_rev_8_21_14_2_50_48_46]PIW47258.1 MAG: hypothetical protein COW20_13725 [bacterium (Candidatus Blackallbacteria) CG13_big_fil_rev_8_21_14_2_50_49_14]